MSTKTLSRLLIAPALLVGTLLACQLEAFLPAATPTPTATRTRTRTPTAVRLPPTIAAPPIPTQAPAPVNATATANVRIRAAPSTSAAIVGRLNQGEKAQIVGRTPANDWWQISLPSDPSARGWVSAEFATADGPVDAIPVIPPSGVQPPAPPAQGYPPPQTYP